MDDMQKSMISWLRQTAPHLGNASIESLNLNDSDGPWFSCISESHCCMSLIVVNFLFSQYVLDSSEQCDSYHFEIRVNYFKFPRRSELFACGFMGISSESSLLDDPSP